MPAPKRTLWSTPMHRGMRCPDCRRYGAVRLPDGSLDCPACRWLATLPVPGDGAEAADPVPADAEPDPLAGLDDGPGLIEMAEEDPDLVGLAD